MNSKKRDEIYQAVDVLEEKRDKIYKEIVELKSVSDYPDNFMNELKREMATYNVAIESIKKRYWWIFMRRNR